MVTSERPVIQTVFNVRRNQVNELTPGSAITVKKNGDIEIFDVLGEGENSRCSFERIYFSRGSDADIYQERKRLGNQLIPDILRAVDNDLENTVISFIPNTAEVAFIGMCEELERELNRRKAEELHKALGAGTLSHEVIDSILSQKLRVEKVAIKDIKLRTFIAEGTSRNDLAAHVYDVTYGCIKNGVDNLVVIDDSIVRGTTLKQSILSMLDRLHPRRIVVVSSSPQVRYPDCYGIDMSRMGEFIAFRAAVALLKQRGMGDTLDMVYRRCLEELEKPATEQINCVKMIYEPFSDEEISDKIAEMIKPNHAEAEIKISDSRRIAHGHPRIPRRLVLLRQLPHSRRYTAGKPRLCQLLRRQYRQALKHRGNYVVSYWKKYLFLLTLQ